MIQSQEKKHDIYQILSFCLGFLKRKILTLLKISMNQRKLSFKPELIIQMANQQLKSHQYLLILKNYDQKFVIKQDEILFQRFIYRIKQLVRIYLHHASISHETFVYLKTIQKYSFKMNYRLQDYAIFILQENPLSLHEKIQAKIKQLEKEATGKMEKSPNKNHLTAAGFQNLTTEIPSWQYKRVSLHADQLVPRYERLQGQQSSRFFKASLNDNNRPLDVFNKSVKSLIDCLDCDITVIRAIYFNLHNKSNEILISNRKNMLKQIEEDMLNQNRFIKYTVNAYDKHFAKFQERMEKDPGYFSRGRKRCQTAAITRNQFNLKIFQSSKNKKFKLNKTQHSIQNTRKFQTIGFFPTQEQREQLIRQMRDRKSILKMKSISISTNKGHLQLCSESKQPGKNGSLTMANIKKSIHHNNSKNTAINIKKKYEVFLNTNNQNLTDRNCDQIHSNTLSVSNQSIWREMLVSNQSIWKETLLAEGKPDQHSVRPGQKVLERNSNNKITKFQQIQNDFQVTIRNFMKGTNVNHRNYTHYHKRDKMMYETINPQLTVAKIRKS